MDVADTVSGPHSTNLAAPALVTQDVAVAMKFRSLPKSADRPPPSKSCLAVGTEGDVGIPDGEDIGRVSALPCVEISDSECEIAIDGKSDLEDVPSEDERTLPALKTQRLCDERASHLRIQCAARGSPPTTK